MSKIKKRNFVKKHMDKFNRSKRQISDKTYDRKKHAHLYPHLEVYDEEITDEMYDKLLTWRENNHE